MFDADLILIDGTVITTTATDTPSDPAVLTTVDTTTGAAVVDLGTGGTPAVGLTAVMIFPELGDGADAYYIVAYLQASNTLDMTTGVASERLGNFTLAAATAERLVGAETPCVATVRFATKKRYVRVYYTITGGDMGYLKCYIEPYTFKDL